MVLPYKSRRSNDLEKFGLSSHPDGNYNFETWRGRRMSQFELLS